MSLTVTLGNCQLPYAFIPWIIFPRDIIYWFLEFFAHCPYSAVLTPFLLALWDSLFCDLFPEITFHFFQPVFLY